LNLPIHFTPLEILVKLNLSIPNLTFLMGPKPDHNYPLSTPPRIHAFAHLLIYSPASPARTFAQGGSKNVLKKYLFLRTFAQNVRTFVYFVQLLFIFVQLFTATCANGSKTCAFAREF